MIKRVWPKNDEEMKDLIPKENLEEKFRQNVDKIKDSHKKLLYMV
jgi:hypothetical protein